MIHVLTVAHPRFDTRIWIKEILSLAKAGFPVTYHVADGKGDDLINGIKIIDHGEIPFGCGILFRLRKMCRITCNLHLKRGDWLHFHDGIYLPFALILAIKGCRIIYDVHEDYPKQVLNSRFPAAVKFFWSIAMQFMEWISRFFFKGYFTATSKIAERFPKNKTSLIHNYPIPGELVVDNDKSNNSPPPNGEMYALYVGAIAEIRGAKEMIEAIADAASSKKLKLVIAGRYSHASLKTELQSMPGWDHTIDLGWLDRQGIAKWLYQSQMGLVTLHPTDNYLDALPVKLFEYMSAGIPVIASDFPLWRKIVEDAECGLLVNPLDPKQISEAMRWLTENPNEAKKMGASGQRAIKEKYNWHIEETRLINAYKSLLEIHF